MNCLRCGKLFRRKYDLNRHLNAKKECPSIYLDISRELMMSNYDYYYKLFLEHRENMDVISQSTKIECDTNQFPCERCGRIFNHRSNYYVHKSKHCRVIKLEQEQKAQFEENNQQLMEELLQFKINLLEMNYEEKLNKEKEALEEKIKTLEDILTQQLVQHQNSTNNTQYNMNNNSGQIAENINNITINYYGNEDLSSIDKKVFERIASNEYNMIQALIDYIHVETECNRNIYIPSHKEKYALVWKDEQWVLVDKHELIDELVFEKRRIMQKLLNVFQDDLEDVNANRTQCILNYLEKDPYECKKIRSDVLTNLMSKGDAIRFTFEDVHGEEITYRRKRRAR